jgi:hypothetical protein
MPTCPSLDINTEGWSQTKALRLAQSHMALRGQLSVNCQVYSWEKKRVRNAMMPCCTEEASAREVGVRPPQDRLAPCTWLLALIFGAATYPLSALVFLIYFMGWFFNILCLGGSVKK